MIVCDLRYRIMCLSIVMMLLYNTYYFKQFSSNKINKTRINHIHKFNISIYKETPSLLIACIVVTFKKPNDDDTAKVTAHHQMALMYKKLEPYIQGYLANTPTSMEYATGVWRDTGHSTTQILNKTETNEYNTPHLSSMLLQTERVCPSTALFIGYANADILFDYGLIHTLEALQNWDNEKHNLVIVGQRLNLDLLDISNANQQLIQYHINSTKKSLFSDSIVNKAELFIDVAQDYFIFSRSLLQSMSLNQSNPSDKWILPNYVIGRRAYDNAIVDWAHHHACLVDATLTVQAIHQTTSDGNYAGHSMDNLDKEYNVNLPDAVYDHGSTGFARYQTINKKGIIEIRDKQNING